MRRWYRRYQEFGYDGLYDRRRGWPIPKRVPVETVEWVREQPGVLRYFRRRR